MAPHNFTPNTSCGPCLYCGRSSEGRPEELLACELCRRPLHIACLRDGLPQTSLLGDNFFRVTCMACSLDGKERVVRPNLSSLHILLLILYNIHQTQADSSKVGFFHWKVHVIRFLTNHWKEFESPEMPRKRKKLIQNSLSGQLSHYTKFFVSGQSLLDEGGWYKLVRVVPPARALLGVTSGLGGKEAGTEDMPGEVEPSSVHQPPPPPSTIKSEPQEADEWTYPDPSASNWFTERGILTPNSLPPKALFEGEERCEEDEEEEEEERTGGGGGGGGGGGPGPGGESESVTDFHKRLAEMKQEITIKEEEATFEGFENTAQREEKEEEEECDVEEGMEEEGGLGNIKEEDDGGGGGGEIKYLSKNLSLFPSSSSSSVPPLFLHSGSPPSTHSYKNLRRMNCYEEKILLRHLERKATAAPGRPLPPHLYRLRRKLAVRRQKVEHGLPLFNLDEEMEHWRRYGRMRTKRERMTQQGIARDAIHQHSSASGVRILDRFQVARQYKEHREDHNISFAARLGGSDATPAVIRSPYTLRYLKPYILRDHSCTPPKLQLLREIVAHHHRGEEGWRPSPPPPIDYCYVTPRHIPAMNQLAHHFFWPGVDLSEVLQYPDHTCVVLYRHLVVGFGVLVPDTSYNEAYLSFLLVHPEWRRAGIATFLLYHLIQSCQGKDVTLHVSATNPALILYQRFGFKVEEFLSNFYDKYLPDDSPECKHAMYMRLGR
ncbi:cysteine-rich protein 2-binding protein-like isoform X1 [Eriocheir sinensis]|uniref:cysteine-rich protein 2-binding protein-like isoform X1 n=1 Tax=Eriocheir sinensis TaxID=95602 RepID=UPI0021C5C9DF|nr:cysteine-rich protein 2-binding protein-like isoform X1 [Eriocheir sinensis]XP_050689430.1 cysteine-rich protein 2-binding protein-like isoform X1 [Eriocheir sinensis]XP_050689431.1 cysteine-rich protein 2-binding protein-like isoform X1 [Eriocheir sinensis]XP_050689432.1 cysteine-rich protein 2-binding protein-like isoform X1 [Eriocheir sinensis]XP_050689433.1 cysteine-rich protein 2-binding protein-like isoform X1 [Eriocheir sinensis]XP_050689434.1 cysteine-rich protein 2-binding protein-